MFDGDFEARQALDQIFSRDVLGSVFVGVSAGKIVEQAIVIFSPGRPERLVLWSITFLISVAVFVYWHRLAQAAKSEEDQKKQNGPAS